MATRILNCLGGVGDEIESELPDQSSQVCAVDDPTTPDRNEPDQKHRPS